MKSSTIAICALILTVAACGSKTGGPAQNSAEPANAVTGPAPAPPRPVANEELASKPAALPEPKGPIDPKSVEAAGQVVQHYGALIEQGRWAEAEHLWADRQRARAFTSHLRPLFKDVHLEITETGGLEGAAGSVYANVPVAFYGQPARAGTDARIGATFALRRVNDVPGSSQEQRRWHIDSVALEEDDE